ncbi:MAG: hypothetical protein JSU05_10835 [Bacteroidetes bacterium]|nr:hypothetical protein [Bacteroidota bacterium]
MDHKNKLEELHKESLLQLEDYIKSKKEIKKDDHAKLHSAKEEWKTAWNKLLQVLFVLDKIEI